MNFHSPSILIRYAIDLCFMFCDYSWKFCKNMEIKMFGKFSLNMNLWNYFTDSTEYLVNLVNLEHYPNLEEKIILKGIC